MLGKERDVPFHDEIRDCKDKEKVMRKKVNHNKPGRPRAERMATMRRV